MNTVEENMSLETLKWYLESGVDEVTTNTPINRFTAQKPDPIPVTHSPVSYPQATKPLNLPLATSSQDAFSSALDLAQQATSLGALQKVVEQFEGCPLKLTATNTVFGIGPEDAQVIFIGEAPGADEDRMGEPFVGVSGKLLDEMIKSIGLSRKENAYISNILFWRPPGNRNPTHAETAICLPFVKRYIELINPKIIVFLGGAAANALLDLSQGITRIRGKWYNYETGKSDSTIDSIPTFHPAYLLRSPIQKAKAWQDLLEIKKRLEEE